MLSDNPKNRNLASIHREEKKNTEITRIYLSSGDTSTISGSSNFTFSNQEQAEFISPHPETKKNNTKKEVNLEKKKINEIKEKVQKMLHRRQNRNQ